MPTARLLLAAMLLCATGRARGAEPLHPELMRHIPADARVLAGLNMATLGASAAGRGLISLVEATYPRLKILNGLPGFDPSRDALQVVLAATGQANANHTILLVRGALDPGRMQAAGLHQESFDGVPVLHAEGDNASWLAFLEQGIAALGSRESIQRLLARRNLREQSGSGLLRQAAELSRRFDVWAVSTAPAAELASTMPEGQVSGILRGDVMKSVTETRFGAEAGPPIRLQAEVVARSGQDAATLAEVVKFFAEVLQLSAKIRGPKGSDAGSDPLAKLEVRTQGNLVRAFLVLDERQLATLVGRASEIGLR
jgi:hypothetical protein